MYRHPPSDKYCWCEEGTVRFTGRRHSGAPLPHGIHDERDPFVRHAPNRELTDDEWADAMLDTPFATELTAERERLRAVIS